MIERLAKLAAALVLALALPAGQASAHEYAVGQIEIGHPWSRATPGTARVAGGFLEIGNGGDAPDRLVSVASDIAGEVQIHEMKIGADGMASMNRLEAGLDIPAGSTVVLKPGSYHLMFVGLKHPLKEGDSFAAALTFEKAGTIEVEFAVGPLGGGGPQHQ